MTKGQFVEIRTVVIQSGTFVVPKITEILLKIYFETAGHTDFLYVIGSTGGGLPLYIRIKCVNYDVYFTVPCILTQTNQSSYPAIKALANLRRYLPGLFKQWSRRLLD